MNNFNLTGRIARLNEKEKVTFVTLAAKKPFKVKDGDPDSWFIEVSVFSDHSRKFLKEYCAKGDMIGVEGQINTIPVKDSKLTQIGLTANRVELLARSAANANANATNANATANTAPAPASEPAASDPLEYGDDFLKELEDGGFSF